MGEQNNILTVLNIPTHNLTTETIQLIMTEARKETKSNIKYGKNIWDQIGDELWRHLKCGFSKIDNQLLCATCFYTVMNHSNKKAIYLDEIIKIIEAELSPTIYENNIKENTTFAVSLIYGLFQSPLLMMKDVDEDIKRIIKILTISFKALVQLAYQYTQYTFIVFKTMRMFQKLSGTTLQIHVFSKDNQVILLNLVNHNWENPITGVRDQNKEIFKFLLTIVDEEMYKNIIKEINNFYWNKAKYLMLAEITLFSSDIPKLILENNWVTGLIYSLYKPGLVSAGADMYTAVLKKLKSEEEWSLLFLDHIMEVFKGSAQKAIENFNNYWCLLTLKTFPKVLNIISIEIANTLTDNKVFVSLCLMKQCSKLGLLNNSYKLIDEYSLNIKEIINCGLEDNNPQVRMLAFDIVCLSQSRVLPSTCDYQLILHFLNNNINSDCTVLRLGMLSSFTYFCTQLHVLFLNKLSDNKNNELVHIDNLCNFCLKLQELIIISVGLNGNYQRKITSIKLCYIILNSFSEVHSKRKDQIKKNKTPLIEFLKEKQLWVLSKQEFVEQLINLLKDPSDDVRENTIKILLHYYSEKVKETVVFNKIIDNASKSIRSKFFYEISCGQTLFKLICHLLHKNNIGDAMFQSIDDIFIYGYKELATQWRLQKNVMKTIEDGKQMHSFMNILIVVIETQISYSMKITTLDNVKYELLDVLEGIMKQFSWDQQDFISSDFSKMNDMIQEIIIQSGCSPTDCEDETKTSGLHQIVLNCIWLNLKASCDLAALLIQYFTNNTDVCKRCLTLITHTLETSRHKGAIEAAGAALGRSIQHLTSLPNSFKVSELPMLLLEMKLNKIKMEANIGSITRRGAGLSIMFHRIVCSDMRKEKPLFHYFMKIILEMFSRVEDVPKMPVNLINIENKMDLPKALQIHFLTKIVTDSSLASDIMHYSTDLSTLALCELNNSHWQIRNAALQLYGALVPKLIGQKKASGIDEETIATVACDELRTHLPKLWNYILDNLQNMKNKDIVLSHSNLVPILNMLANSAKRYYFSYDTTMKLHKELLGHLFFLLGSPIFIVRRLTAQCIFNIFNLKDILNALINLNYTSENVIHGSLILVDICHNYYFLKHPEKFQLIKNKLANVLTSGCHSYQSRYIFEKIFCDFNEEEIVKAVLEVNNNKHAPGIFLWASGRLKKYIRKSTWNQIPRILKVVLTQRDFEAYCEFVCEKIEKSAEIPENILNEIITIFIVSENKSNSSLIWKILYIISLKFDMYNYVDAKILLKDLDLKKVYKMRYIIPLTATILAKSDERSQLQFINLVFSFCDPYTTDVDLRLIATKANNDIGKIFDKVSDSVRIISLKIAVVLLQDEDDDIRNLSVQFYKNLTNGAKAVHAYICLNRILDPEFLITVFNVPKIAIEKLCEHLDDVLKRNKLCTEDDYNPFTNYAKNIYLEPEVLKAMIFKLKKI